jgi:hypothetical protein
MRFREDRLEMQPGIPLSTSRRRIGRTTLATLACLLIVALLGQGCVKRETEAQSMRFAHGAHDVEVTFHGEVSSAQLFDSNASLLDQLRPRDEAGRPSSAGLAALPNWLRFEYRIDGQHREVLLAKQPLLNDVSWEDIARAGAALGDDTTLTIDGLLRPQNATVRDRQGNAYRVRLPVCGQATHADLSEWNLLIGAVHRGDMDFRGERYGWVRSPYRDDDLKVGYKGSLTWCRDEWNGKRVARGYFYVSRFHAESPQSRTDRLHWRPVLERVPFPSAARQSPAQGDPLAPVRWSRSLRAGYIGRVSNADLVGSAGDVDRQLLVESGRRLDASAPDWLRFEFEGKTLLVAARPLRYGLSWSAIARAGAALGDDSEVTVGPRRYRQSATVVGAKGERYRVRLLRCGHSTLDLGSEWNALIGGVHGGDGDFRADPDGIYGWLNPSFTDDDLGVGSTENGSATWCRETLVLDGKVFAVNRGHLTVSRFHATEISFDGTGFGWRPVLEPMP